MAQLIDLFLDFLGSCVQIQNLLILLIASVQQLLDSVAIVAPLLIEVLDVLLQEDLLGLQMFLLLLDGELAPAQLRRLLLVLRLTHKQRLVIVPLHVLVHDLVLRLDHL